MPNAGVTRSPPTRIAAASSDEAPSGNDGNAVDAPLDGSITSSQSGEPSMEGRMRSRLVAVEIGHVRTSSSRLRSAACAAFRVAATVPVRIPSASPIAT